MRVYAVNPQSLSKLARDPLLLSISKENLKKFVSANRRERKKKGGSWGVEKLPANSFNPRKYSKTFLGSCLSSSFPNADTVTLLTGDLVHSALVRLFPFLCLVIANPFHHSCIVAYSYIYVHFLECLDHFISVLSHIWYGS